MPIIVSLDQHYRTRNGRVVLVTNRIDPDDERYKVFGYAFVARTHGSSYFWNYTPLGEAVGPGVTDPYDLVELVDKSELYSKPKPRKIVLPLGTLQSVILRVVENLGDDAWEPAVRRDVIASTGKRVRPLYMLDRARTLRCKNFLVIHDESHPSGGPQSAIRFVITEPGRAILEYHQRLLLEKDNNHESDTQRFRDDSVESSKDGSQVESLGHVGPKLTGVVCRQP